MMAPAGRSSSALSRVVNSDRAAHQPCPWTMDVRTRETTERRLDATA